MQVISQNCNQISSNIAKSNHFPHIQVCQATSVKKITSSLAKYQNNAYPKCPGTQKNQPISGLRPQLILLYVLYRHSALKQFHVHSNPQSLS